jgi:hypothetical protein
MNNQSNNWFAVHIQVTADFSRRVGFPQEFLANPCFKLFSSGITLTDEGIAAYFNTSNNPELIQRELRSYGVSLLSLGIPLSTPHISRQSGKY